MSASKIQPIIRVDLDVKTTYYLLCGYADISSWSYGLRCRYRYARLWSSRYERVPDVNVCELYFDTLLRQRYSLAPTLMKAVLSTMELLLGLFYATARCVNLGVEATDSWKR